MRDKLITKEQIQKGVPQLRGRFGGIVTTIAMQLCGLRHANDLYDHNKQYEGVEFCRRVLEETGINLVIEGSEVLDNFRETNFVTVANHPYGHIDGLATIAVVGEVRPDYKVMANFVLGLIDTISMHFIAVNPFHKGKPDAAAMESIRAALAHIEEGHPFGFFPAGAVSDPKLRGLRFTVNDRQWKPSTVRMIKKVGVPVIPIYFSGQNSWFYNLLGMISWRLRTLRIPREIVNKRGKTVYMRFGEPVMPSEMEKAAGTKELGALLRGKVYDLANEKD